MNYPENLFIGFCEYPEKKDSFRIQLFDQVCAWLWVTLSLIMFI